MKKRVIAIVLTLALLGSLMAAISVPSSAAAVKSPVMGKTKAAMYKELTDFVKIATVENNGGQVARDDYKNMPEGLNTIHPLTVELQNKSNAADDLARKAKNGDSSDMALVKELEDFLLDLYGGWGYKKDKDGKDITDQAMDYLDANKPFTAFQDTLNLRWAGDNFAHGNLTGLAYEIYFNPENPLSTTYRKDYTHESWEALRAVVEKIEDYTVVTEQYPFTHLAVATRSEIYYLIQEYKAAYKALVKFDGDTAVNEYKGYLFDVINVKKNYDWEMNDLLAIMDKTKNSPEKDALEKFYNDAKAAWSDPNATLEQVQSFLDIEPRIATKKKGILRESEVKKLLASGDLKEEDIKHKLDIDGKETTEREILYSYETKFTDSIQAFRDSIYVGNQYRAEKDAIYNEARLDNLSGRYEAKYWDAFMGCFADGDKLLVNYLSKESEFMKAIETVKTAYAELLTHRISDPQHKITYDKIKAWLGSISDLSKYTSTSMSALDAAIKRYEDLVAAGKTADQTDDQYEITLYEASLVICAAKDALELVPDPNPIENGNSLKDVLNQISLIVEEARFMVDSMQELFDEGGFDENQKEAFDLFTEAFIALDDIVTKGQEEIAKQEADSTFTLTVTTENVFKALLEMYQAQNNLTLMVAAPSTSND